jgi:hypothetical protein
MRALRANRLVWWLLRRACAITGHDYRPSWVAEGVLICRRCGAARYPTGWDARRDEEV